MRNAGNKRSNWVNTLLGIGIIGAAYALLRRTERPISKHRQLVRDFMTKDVRYVTPQTNLDDAANLMRQHRIGILPVCEGSRLVGVVSDRDITVRAVSETLYTGALQVKNVMSRRRVIFAHDDQTLEEAIDLMKSGRVRRLPVLDRDGVLCGILSVDDLAKRPELAGDLLEKTARRYGSFG